MINFVEVINMANNQQQPNKTQSGTSVQHVKQQNAQAAQGQQQYGAEFASETDAQHVKKYNQQAEAKKNQNS